MLALKHRLTVLTDVSPDALHMLAGIAIYVVMAMAFDRRVSSWRALLATVAVAVTGEGIDWTYYSLRGEMVPWSAFLADLRDALIWPMVLTLVGKRIAAASPAAGHSHG